MNDTIWSQIAVFLMDFSTLVYLNDKIVVLIFRKMDLVKILGIFITMQSRLPLVCVSQSAICAKGNSICIPEVKYII